MDANIENPNKPIDVYKEGSLANDYNRRINRLQTNESRLINPYPPGSPENRLWNDGYNYRDMVNDG